MSMVHPIFSCLALLEHETCVLYEVMRDKAESKDTRLLLDKILLETGYHRDILEKLSSHSETGSKPTDTECSKHMGRIFTEALTLARSVREDTLRGVPLLKGVEKLLEYEEKLSEEYATETYCNVLSTVEGNLAVRKILEDIAQDEKRHVETLKIIIGMLSKNSLAETDPKLKTESFEPWQEEWK
jgi:rubrerythrin